MRTIKRYKNRKLYDTVTKRYVTLEDIKGYLADGPVQIVDWQGYDASGIVFAELARKHIVELSVDARQDALKLLGLIKGA